MSFTPGVTSSWWQRIIELLFRSITLPEPAIVRPAGEGSARQAFLSELRDHGLDPETELKRGMFHYLSQLPAPRPELARRKSLRITFLHAGQSPVIAPDGSRIEPQEMFSFTHSIQGSHAAILSAIECDQAVSYDLSHRLEARLDQMEAMSDRSIEDIAHKSDMVLVSCNTTAFNRAEAIVRTMKAVEPDLLIVWGGTHATLHPNEVMEAGADFAVLYEGCVTGCGLIRHLVEGGEQSSDRDTSLGQLPNLVFRTRAGELRRTPRMRLKSEEGFAPFPPFMSNRHVPVAIRRQVRVLSLTAAPGCPNNCDFCLSCRSTGITRRPVENVVADLREMHGLRELDSTMDGWRLVLRLLAGKIRGGDPCYFRPRETFFGDDNLGRRDNRAYAKRLFRAMREYFDTVGVYPYYFIQVGVDFFEDEELVTLARRAGVRRVACGFETLSPEALQKIGKKHVKFDEVKRQYEDAMAMARRVGIAIHGYFIVGFGESEEDMKATIKCATDNGVGVLQILFLSVWNKQSLGVDNPTVLAQPEADIHALLKSGNLPAYLLEPDGQRISRAAYPLHTGGLVPMRLVPNLAAEELYRIRMALYRRFYGAASIWAVFKNRNQFPDWITTMGLRFQFRTGYFRYLRRFERKFETISQLRKEKGAISPYALSSTDHIGTARERDQLTERRCIMEKETGKVFVGALPFRMCEGALRALFEPYGEVKSVAIHANWQEPDGEPCAHIEMENSAEAIEALDGTQVGLTHLRVHELVTVGEGRP
ncbi:MAG: hypothetical protein C0404_12605 [Verrucomicrobia bacterium]|nr:hypothetical protein [Verrucomicrobiota bacterium]